jgi:molybdopterin synthase sulfur carrier subunit
MAAQQHTVTLRYFAWIRERVGRADESVVLPSDVRDVAALVSWLQSRGPEYAHAFERAELVRAALDQVHAKPAASLHGVREIAFFPPVTGG